MRGRYARDRIKRVRDDCKADASVRNLSPSFACVSRAEVQDGNAAMKTKPPTPTTDALRRQIEVRAYLIWERDGRSQGRHAEHWAKAEKEILGEQKGKALKKTKTAPSPKPSSKRSSKTKKS
jgi:hypothetical protein